MRISGFAGAVAVAALTLGAATPAFAAPASGVGTPPISALTKGIGPNGTAYVLTGQVRRTSVGGGAIPQQSTAAVVDARLSLRGVGGETWRVTFADNGTAFFAGTARAGSDGALTQAARETLAPGATVGVHRVTVQAVAADTGEHVTAGVTLTVR